MGLPVFDSTADILGQPEVCACASGGEGMNEQLFLITHNLQEQRGDQEQTNPSDCKPSHKCVGS